MLVQTMPTLLPCQMVDVIVDDVGLPKYSCYEVRSVPALVVVNPAADNHPSASTLVSSTSSSAAR